MRVGKPAWRRSVAVLGSFGVYVIPLVGPHAAWFLGQAVVGSVSGDRSLAWKAADVSVALVSQFAVGLVLYWSLDGTWVRKIIWLGILPLIIGVNAALLSAIPAFFLIESDTEPEVNTWAEHCFVSSIELRPVRASAARTEPGPRAWWASRSPDGRDTLFEMPTCMTTDAVLPVAGASTEGYLDFFIAIQSASHDGIAIVEQTDRRTNQRTWSILMRPETPLQRLDESSDIEQTPPIISRRGDAVAYVRRVDGSGPPVLSQVIVRKATPQSSAVEADIDLAPLGPGSYEALDVDAGLKEVLLWRHDGPIRVGFDGQPRPISFKPGDIEAQGSTYLRVGDGWVAWDAYKENGPYQIGWSLPAGSGRHHTKAGRSVTSAAVDPTGSYIAVSETTTLSIGNAKDVVYVLRARDGAVVFRRYLPRYSRSHLVFFDGGFFGYSDPAGTHVLILPADETSPRAPR